MSPQPDPAGPADRDLPGRDPSAGSAPDHGAPDDGAPDDGTPDHGTPDDADPLAGTAAPAELTDRTALARRLTALREAGGLSVRDVARLARLPLSTVGGYLSGRHLPPLAALDQFDRVLAALGVPLAERPAWVEAIGRLRRAPGPRPATATAPYLGLAAYDVADAHLFVGRERSTRELVDRVLAGPALPLVVLGASGSGKSSLLRAGLTAALRGAGTRVTVTTAGALLADPGLAEAGDPQVLVVDQLEEVLVAEQPEVVDAAVRPVDAAPVRGLLDLLGARHEAGSTVVLGLRADTVERALEHDELAAWLTGGAFAVTPLTDDDLRRVIVEPARQVGVEVEEALVDVLVREAIADPATQRGRHRTVLGAGVLPLASHALYATWAASSGRRLTLARYREVGGLGGAIAQSAEAVVSALPPDRLAVVRRVLLALVHVRDPLISARAVPLADLVAAGADESAVVSALIAERLLTSDRGQVRIAHEALLSAWPRLAGWIDEDQDALRVHGRLAEAAQAWSDADRDGDLLLRGAQLDAALAWEREGRTTTAAEHAFVVESRAAHDRFAAARRRSARRLRLLSACLAVLALTSASLAGAAVHQSQVSGRERDLAVARQLAVTAESLAGTDPGLSAQVAAAAFATAGTVEARSALLSSTGIATTSRLGSAGALVNEVAVSPDGTLAGLATDDSAVLLWSIGAEPRQVARLDVPDGALYAVAFTPDGSTLLAGGDAGVLHAWSLADPAAPVPVPVGGAAAGATFYDVSVPDGGGLVVATASDGTVRRWSTGPGTSLSLIGAVTGADPAATAGPEAAALDPAGRHLAVAGSTGQITVWDLTDPASPTVTAEPVDVGASVQSLAWSPDGGTLAAGTTGGSVELVDLAADGGLRRGATLTGPASWVNALDWSPDGAALAAASSDQQVWVWDTATGQVAWQAATPTTLLTARWSPDGALLYGSGADGMLREWSVPGPVLGGFASIPGQGAFGTDGDGEQVVVTATTDGLRVWGVDDPARATLLGSSPAPDGARLDGAVDVSDTWHLAVAGDTTGTIHAWDISDAAAPVYVGSVTAHADWVDTIAFDATGSRMAVSSDDGTVTTWQLVEAALPAVPVGRASDLGGAVYVVAFSPDGSTLVASVLSGSVRLLDVQDLAEPTVIGEPLTGPAGYVYSTAFSPDGRTIAATGNDGTLWLWDVTDRERPEQLGGPLRWAEGYGTNCAFSPDGSRVAVAMTDGTVRIWDLSARDRPARWAVLSGAAGTVYGLEFSAAGDLLSAASADRTVRLWDVTVAGALVRVCTQAERGLALTDPEWDRIAGSEVARPVTCV